LTAESTIKRYYEDWQTRHGSTAEDRRINRLMYELTLARAKHVLIPDCVGRTELIQTPNGLRTRYMGAFKAKVGLEAMTGFKTVEEIARDYTIEPALIKQWKGVIQDRLPELFEPKPGDDDFGKIWA